MNSLELYIPIEKIRKNNNRIRSIECDITVPSSEDWVEEAASLIEDKLNYRNYSIRGFDSIIKCIVNVGFSKVVQSLDNKKIYKLNYWESIRFWLTNDILPDSDSKNYHLRMNRNIIVAEVFTKSI